MIVLPHAPWWPLVVAKAFGDKALTFAFWLRWHHDCLLHGEGFNANAPLVEVRPAA